jgi:hypothetical protein
MQNADPPGPQTLLASLIEIARNHPLKPHHDNNYSRPA